MQTRLAGERGDQDCDHGGQQGQEGGIRQVLSAGPCLAKRGLVGERAQRVYVGEEVVDEGVERGQGAYLLGREVGGLRRRLELRQDVGGIGGRLGRWAVRVDGAHAALLDGFGMAIWWPTAAAGALKGAWDLESDTGSTGRA